MCKHHQQYNLNEKISLKKAEVIEKYIEARIGDENMSWNIIYV